MLAITDTAPVDTHDDARPSHLQLPPGPWTTVLDGLCARFPRVDRATWQDRFARGRVQDAAGRALRADVPYRVGLQVRYFREVADEPAVPFAEAVLHVDAHLVVADKPHFLAVAPTGRHVRETLLARLVRRLGNADLAPVHRIDRDTAGLVLFSANAATRGAYQALFRERRITKHYRALAPPLPGQGFPCVRSSRLEAGEPFFRMREVHGPANTTTGIDVLQRGPDAWTYALTPVTGRKHQLRVHMAALGAPILGDRLYPDHRTRADDDFTHPLKLLAHALEFTDPITGAQRRFTSARRL